VHQFCVEFELPSGKFGMLLHQFVHQLLLFVEVQSVAVGNFEGYRLKLFVLPEDC
jgi:hypothetical protein